MLKSHLDKVTAGVAGKFLELITCYFTDEQGRPRNWEAVKRTNSTGGVMILAESTTEPHSVILVRQFRPPTGQYTIELPAGLIDQGETPPAAAVRELYEETGFHGQIKDVLPASFCSPGMSSEQIITVRMSFDYNPHEPLPPTHQEDTEHIEVFVVPISKVMDFIHHRIALGDGVDAKLLLSFCEKAK